MDLTTEIIKADFDSYVMATEGRKPSKQGSNWMSSIGHPCPRYLYYLRVEGDKRVPWPLFLLKKFREGKEHERRAKADVMGMGYDWVEAQASVAFHDLDLFGKHDGRCSKGGSKPKLSEIKSMSPGLFAQVKGNHDYVLQSKYTRNGVAQFNAYLVGLSEPDGFFFFRNRDDGDLEPQLFTVDMDLWEKTAKKLRVVNKAVAAKEPPERCGPVDRDDLCAKCNFNHICLPDIINEGGITFLDEPEVVANLERLEELRPMAKEFERLQDWKKARFRNIDGAVAGDFLVEGKQIEFLRKSQDEKYVSFWKSNVTRITKG